MISTEQICVNFGVLLLLFVKITAQTNRECHYDLLTMQFLSFIFWESRLPPASPIFSVTNFSSPSYCRKLQVLKIFMKWKKKKIMATRFSIKQLHIFVCVCIQIWVHAISMLFLCTWIVATFAVECISSSSPYAHPMYYIPFSYLKIFPGLQRSDALLLRRSEIYLRSCLLNKEKKKISWFLIFNLGTIHIHFLIYWIFIRSRDHLESLFWLLAMMRTAPACKCWYSFHFSVFSCSVCIVCKIFGCLWTYNISLELEADYDCNIIVK